MRVPHALTVALAVLSVAPLRAQAPEAVVSQTALSPCPTLRLVEQRDVPPGTAIVVSPDGRRLAEYFHILGGAEIILHDRDTSEVHRLRIEAPQLPPGILWRIQSAAFSPAGDLLAIQSTGLVRVYDAASGEKLYDIGFDSERQLYPGHMTLGGERLAVIFWPAENVLAAAKPKQLIAVHIYEARSGKQVHSLFLPIRTPDAWTRIELSPDAERLAVLMRATRWPAKAHLALFKLSDGTLLWERKVSAEDVEWTADLQELALLGDELQWLDAATGKELRAAEKKLGSSENHRLRLSDPTNTALGTFLRYSKWKRTVNMGEPRDAEFRMWRLDDGKATCAVELDPSLRVDAWPTSRREVIALEETYDLKPQLRILRAARIVIYRIE